MESCGFFRVRKRSFSVRSTCARFPALEKSLNAIFTPAESAKCAISASLDDSFLEQRFGKWGLALAGKSRGQDAGGWFDEEVGEGGDPKSISHEHTFSVDTADAGALDAFLVRLSEMVARRLRDHRLWARTVQIKLRYSDFSTFTTLQNAGSCDADRFRAGGCRSRALSPGMEPEGDPVARRVCASPRKRGRADQSSG